MPVDVLVRPIICAITDRARFGSDDDIACERVVAAAALVARGGVDLIQVRERGLTDRRLLELVRQVKAAVGRRARVLVNERTDVALAAGADGVHLPASAIGPEAVRTIVPEGFLIGRSVHDSSEAVAAAERGGCDYLLFGTVFWSASKPAEHPVAGVGALAETCKAVPLPVLAIGGITLENAAEAARAGAAGIAAIGLFAHGARAALDASPGMDAPPLRKDLGRIVQALRAAFDVKH